MYYKGKVDHMQVAYSAFKGPLTETAIWR